MKGKGLLMVNTGNGKGKTTAAFGQALRVAGNAGRVAVVQFIKGKWPSGEVEAARRLGIEVHRTGSGFTWKSAPEEVAAAGRRGWEIACRLLADPGLDLLVLDELTHLVNRGVLDGDEVARALRDRPAGLHVVVTGRDAPAVLLDMADTVTEMREVRHHFHAGVKAAAGVEY
jgi:cob(I)alamin adenosyltransferase